MAVARLDLLRDGVHVAEAAFELVGAENGGRAGHVIGGIDHRGGLVNRQVETRRSAARWCSV